MTEGVMLWRRRPGVFALGRSDVTRIGVIVSVFTSWTGTRRLRERMPACYSTMQSN